MMQMGSMGSGVECEDAVHLGDGLRIFRRTVIARCDKFASGTVKMAAPISNNTVAAVRTVAASAVTDDRVIWNSRRDRNGVDRHHETIVRRHSVDAVGKTLQLQRGGVGGETCAQSLTDRKQFCWGSHQHRADAPDPVAGEIRTAMRTGHENYASYFSSMLEDD